MNKVRHEPDISCKAQLFFDPSVKSGTIKKVKNQIK